MVSQHSISSEMNGKLVCACGSKLTRLSDRMLLVWADHEGERWNWHTDVQVYFRFCKESHMKTWPEDMRCRGKNSPFGILGNGHSMDTQWTLNGHYNGHYNGHW